jgi:preprotein translocase subunit SecF
MKNGSEFRRNPVLNILGKRYFFFGLSLVIIVSGLVLLAITGLPLSIDFKGGTLFEIKFTSGTVPTTEQVSKIYSNINISDPQVSTSGTDILLIRSSSLTPAELNTVETSLKETSKGDVVILKADTVGPSIGKGVTRNALLAVGLAALAVILYITFAFRGIPHAVRYGICAIIAMVHDVLIVIALTGYGAKFFGWQIDSLYLTAVLTVIGFSVQDKVVVFDRIRENSGIYRKLDFEKLTNHSIVQTLQRSINTQLMTVEFFLLSLALFGGVTLREFAVILLVGLFSGTYSSIFIAAPILVVWEKKEWKTWFKKNQTTTA